MPSLEQANFLPTKHTGGFTKLLRFADAPSDVNTTQVGTAEFLAKIAEAMAGSHCRMVGCLAIVVVLKVMRTIQQVTA
jgi:hypothetical protein